MRRINIIAAKAAEAKAAEAKAAEAKAAEATDGNARLRPRSEYHEDYGVVCWWDSGVCDSHEPPYMGTPNDIGADGMYCLPDEYEWWSPCPDFEPMVRANESAAAAAAEHTKKMSEGKTS